MAGEPKEKGGQDKGFSPKELLVSALAACTSATVGMYSDRKEWELTNVHIETELIEDDGKTIFKRKLQFEGKLDERQRQRLLNRFLSLNGLRIRMLVSPILMFPRECPTPSTVSGGRSFSWRLPVRKFLQPLWFGGHFFTRSGPARTNMRSPSFTKTILPVAPLRLPFFFKFAITISVGIRLSSTARQQKILFLLILNALSSMKIQLKTIIKALFLQ
ncbi:OsmC family protein [Chryseobacterium sp. MDT2-18]|uniref:OsmC family protein n=1 Tax=Chryseobacterium sp. MDT2-18 TaxID=1259136 RepID=UPI00278468F8|nr:OsmC family protein [Chryseobacterium sp. MDT2-18]MDQ0477223.1 hypothetical protein [Chryseobacterium sp. MDT2-18]